jgi:hypothetical protein
VKNEIKTRGTRGAWAAPAALAMRAIAAAAFFVTTFAMLADVRPAIGFD